ncbi:hypothetical protein DFH08DRAFT_694806, partial [Mycena albidolilacea]
MDAVKASAALLKKRRQIRDRRKKEREPSKDAPSRFPPVPPSPGLRHQVISGMCDELDPATLEEMGCAVCGSLTPRIELTKMTDTTVNWDILKVSGVTRKEQFTNHDPIEELDGPVLADRCDSVCTDCESTLLKGAVLLRSLANKIWIGCVPWQLKELSFAERMLISKVQHNRCVVRVASGRGKMSANAIMFATPIVKIYQVLSVSKDELSEVLAFVFLGSARPTEEDFARTPMLLNHRDYADLEISPENLQDLPENGIPCGVDWKETVEGETSNVAEAMSVHDTGEEEEGTAQGPCSFATLKARALTHLKNRGQTLGVGQAEEPESLYHNIQLYPQMFPWLFPYGFGGIGHPSHKKKLSELKHKGHLLMYHDKRFQTNLYFPMVAFNDTQIKSGSTGSHLLA